MTQDEIIRKTAVWIRQGYLSVEDIRDKLLGLGMTEEAAYLTYRAAELLAAT